MDAVPSAKAARNFFGGTNGWARNGEAITTTLAIIKVCFTTGAQGYLEHPLAEQPNECPETTD